MRKLGNLPERGLPHCERRAAVESAFRRAPCARHGYPNLSETVSAGHRAPGHFAQLGVMRGRTTYGNLTYDVNLCQFGTCVRLLMCQSGTRAFGCQGCFARVSTFLWVIFTHEPTPFTEGQDCKRPSLSNCRSKILKYNLIFLGWFGFFRLAQKMLSIESGMTGAVFRSVLSDG